MQVTGVGYDLSGDVVCENEIVRDGSHPSIAKVIEVKHEFLMSTDVMKCMIVIVILKKFEISPCIHYTTINSFQVGVVCNNAQVIEGSLVGQPTEGALMACAMKVNL